jgi:uncharacterized protein YecE (DUF72 family)
VSVFCTGPQPGEERTDQMNPATEDQIHIGTSGWSYKDWDGSFYPQGCGQDGRLRHYAARFSCVEVDSTFYGTPKKETVRAWAARTPGHFRFALKVPGIVTHGAQGSSPILEDVLKDKGGRLADFLETTELLGDKLGPILFQFPYFRVREMEEADFLDRLEATLGRLPTDRRYAVELRNKGWIGARYLALLRRYSAAAVLIDHPYMPGPRQQLALGMVTTDFCYARLLGDRHSIVKKTGAWDRLVEDKGARVKQWAETLHLATTRHGAASAWAFSNNHFAGHSPETSAQLISRLRDLS